jgi:hypothetical protein
VPTEESLKKMLQMPNPPVYKEINGKVVDISNSEIIKPKKSLRRIRATEKDEFGKPHEIFSDKITSSSQHTSVISGEKRYNISIISESDKIASVMPTKINPELISLKLRGIKVCWRKDLKNGAIYTNEGRFLGYMNRNEFRNMYYFCSCVLKDAKKPKNKKEYLTELRK